ncbi:MAG: hypothetical protein V4599_04820 [Verrucomicrobiota bacterium]
MKSGFPAGRTALFFLFLALVAWVKGGAHLVDVFSDIRFTGTEADLGILSEGLGTDVAQYHLQSSRYALIARDLFLVLALLFGIFWLRQRFHLRWRAVRGHSSAHSRRKDRRRRR